eukprot:TRINITY_DN14237_c0_g1_i1.p1 TRINITY_DN14237_c0_g1~~TRINITY_DN14237_c0_g1_i1.p1  ORF type:complete len:310 (+),score=27.84 TRINITY_DN14237_c0_g1_i1:410-1339(+)
MADANTQRGLERLRSMDYEDTSLALGLSVATPPPAQEQKSPPASQTLSSALPLELISVRPVGRVMPLASSSQGSNPGPFPWLVSRSGMDEMTAAESNTVGFGRGNLDMNRKPSDGASIFHSEALRTPENGSLKRDRSCAFELEIERDRTCDVSSRTSDEEEIGSTRKKLRLSKEQSALLEESFREHSTLNPKQKNALAKQLNLRPRQVEVWFQNRRARTKLKQTEVDCELLKRCCETLTEENKRLQKELQELRALKAAPLMGQDYYMPLPATTLTMCPSCERVATMDNNRNLTFSKPQMSQFQQQPAAC